MRGYLLGFLTYAVLFVPGSTWRERYEYPRDLICSWWLLRNWDGKANPLWAD